eukprot:2800095-Amphidinium_carterae.1
MMQRIWWGVLGRFGFSDGPRRLRSVAINSSACGGNLNSDNGTFTRICICGLARYTTCQIVHAKDQSCHSNKEH